MTAPETSPSRSKTPFIIAAVVVVAGLAFAGWYFFVRDDAPAAFDIDSAAESADEADAAGDDTDTGSTEDSAGSADGVSGEWTIDPDAGADAGGTSAGFRVDEELANIGATTAVGRTDQVEGTLTIDDTTVTAADITVDMDSLATDDSRRDGRMRSALATDEFPTGTFSLTEPIELGDLPADGETISVTATGDLTIKGTTNTVDIALDARIVGDTIVVVGAAPVVFEDYGVEKPTAAIVVSLEDEGTFEFQLFFGRA